ncbi:hypothetical protein WA026_011076 [Henosepilachna vigintioctopunctata]|uniref:Uncharacterized protein n=1 Tax=Henosepilachna vigintioctopunctata TaxID=420089 RepID=A0AAW1U751_9CUCU
MKGYNETLEFHISDHLALKFTLSEAIITKSPSIPNRSNLQTITRIEMRLPKTTKLITYRIPTSRTQDAVSKLSRVAVDISSYTTTEFLRNAGKLVG